MKGLARPQLEEIRHALRRCDFGAALGEVRPVGRIVLGVGQHFTNFISHRYRQAIAIIYARKLLTGNAHELPHRAVRSARGGGQGHHAAFGDYGSRQNDRKHALAQFPAEKDNGYENQRDKAIYGIVAKHACRCDEDGVCQKNPFAIAPARLKHKTADLHNRRQHTGGKKDILGSAGSHDGVLRREGKKEEESHPEAPRATNRSQPGHGVGYGTGQQKRLHQCVKPVSQRSASKSGAQPVKRFDKQRMQKRMVGRIVARNDLIDLKIHIIAGDAGKVRDQHRRPAQHEQCQRNPERSAYLQMQGFGETGHCAKDPDGGAARRRAGSNSQGDACHKAPQAGFAMGLQTQAKAHGKHKEPSKEAKSDF